MKISHFLQARGSVSVPPPSQTNRRTRILVVDDDEAIRRHNAEVLARCGYEVDAAEDGAAAWAALNENAYDLMITDNNMPKVSGSELLRKLRSARMTMPVIMATMPVIIATGSSSKAEFTATPRIEPNRFLLKPYTIEELLGTVRNVLREAAEPVATTRLTRGPRSNETGPELLPVSKSVPGPTNGHSRILVVEEDSELRLRYANTLEPLGCYVDLAHDGKAGWETLQADRYNLLITENQMPNLTGVELVRKLRAAHMALPVVMAAASLPTQEELSQHPPLELAATLLKPFPVELLLDTVKVVLRAPVHLSAPMPVAPNGRY